MTGIRVVPSATAQAVSLLRTIQFTHPPTCPCHGHSHGALHSLSSAPASSSASTSALASASTKEYAFELASSTIRFGIGATREVGQDLDALPIPYGASPHVCVVTDPTVNKLPTMAVVRGSLEKAGVWYSVYNQVRIEPKDSSINHAIAFARALSPLPTSFLAVGGGSVIDTAKLMNLHIMYPSDPMTTFVPAPLGAGQPIERPLKPLIAIPTTAGTGSETTGTAIFDLSFDEGKRRVKTGVAHRRLRPMLGICDPLNTRSMPPSVRASSGLDVLCHALESWTAVPFTERPGGAPTHPSLRPPYQGSNPMSDVFAMHALRKVAEFLPRAVRDADDEEAQSEMLLAATFAGVGFGNAGVHLCHAMSYPISSLNPSAYHHTAYPGALIPHGVSVAVTSPSVFRFTAPSSPDRHLAAAAALGADTAHTRREDAGAILSDALVAFLDRIGGQPRGLKALGFANAHVEELVGGTVPQGRVLVLAPGLEQKMTRNGQDKEKDKEKDKDDEKDRGRTERTGGDGLERQREQLAKLFDDAMQY